MTRSAQRRARCQGFTLVELLIVIGIIGLLIGVVLMVGKRVVGSGKERLTQDIIRVLDASVVEYEAVKNDLPPSRLLVSGGADKFEYPVIDARRDGTGVDLVASPSEPSIARYTASLASVAQAQGTLKQIAAKQVRQVVLDTPTVNGKQVQVIGQEILDAWDKPIRAVHPAFHGGYGSYFDNGSLKSRSAMTVSLWKGPSKQDLDYRRSYRPFDPAKTTGQPVGDGDEGLCPSGRIYFYSAGPDFDPGRREDNVYATRPTFSAESATLD